MDPITTPFLTKLLESGISALILVVVLYVFLPRLLKSMDSMIERNTREHLALSTIIMHLVSRLNWHEAKIYQLDLDNPTDTTPLHRAAVDNFKRAQNELESATKQILDALGNQKSP